MLLKWDGNFHMVMIIFAYVWTACGAGRQEIPPCSWLLAQASHGRRQGDGELKCRGGKGSWTLVLGVCRAVMNVGEKENSWSGWFVIRTTWGNYCSPRCERCQQTNHAEKCLPPVSHCVPPQLLFSLPIFVCGVFQSHFVVGRGIDFSEMGHVLKTY